MSKRRIARCPIIGLRSGVACDKPGRVERDGVWYCRMHDPVERQAASITRAKGDDTEWRRQDAKRNFEHAEHERQITMQAALWNSASFLWEVVTGEELTDEWKGRARRCLTPLMDTLRRYRKL